MRPQTGDRLDGRGVHVEHTFVEGDGLVGFVEHVVYAGDAEQQTGLHGELVPSHIHARATISASVTTSLTTYVSQRISEGRFVGNGRGGAHVAWFSRSRAVLGKSSRK